MFKKLGLVTLIFLILAVISQGVPVILPIPDVNLTAGTGFNDNILNLSSFVNDTNNNTIIIINQTNPIAINCSVDNLTFLDCDVNTSKTNVTNITILVTAPDNSTANSSFLVKQ